jgi:hypothetical protein
MTDRGLRSMAFDRIALFREKVLPDEIRWRGPRACSNRT